MFGLFGAWREGRTVFRREPTPLRHDAARLESPRVRLVRRLRLGHLPWRGRAVLAGLFLAALVTGLVTGADRVEAAGGLCAMVLVYLTAHNLGLAGHFAHMEHRAGGRLVTTVAPSRSAKEMPLLLLVPG
jgi:hypothetical protein